MYELKKLHSDAIPHALAKAERYRLLNEAREAESICRDILAVDPGNLEARITLILALSDQFDHRGPAAWADAQSELRSVQDPYRQAYYRGILHERRAKSHTRRRRPGTEQAAFADFKVAMTSFEEAASLAPPGDDDAILRWNSCARILNADPSLTHEADEPVGGAYE